MFQLILNYLQLILNYLKTIKKDFSFLIYSTLSLEKSLKLRNNQRETLNGHNIGAKQRQKLDALSIIINRPKPFVYNSNSVSI